jgi:hypothetical protein
MGVKHEVTVYTDHTNLQYYRQPQKINQCVARYIPRLVEYHFKLIHKPGKYNKADHLSRRPDYDVLFVYLWCQYIILIVPSHI